MKNFGIFWIISLIIIFLVIVFFINKIRVEKKLQEFNLKTDNPNEIVLQGEFLRAYAIAYKDFIEQKDITDEDKILKNYTIGFINTKDAYVIHFRPNLLNSKDAKKYNSMYAGKIVKYWVFKNKFTIKDRLFYK